MIKMLILGIDTSTTLCGVALIEGGQERGAEYIDDGRSHSDKLMPLIHRLLEREGVRMSELDAFAVARGPGSFTGVRIGLSVGRGFSMATSKPAIGVPTLDAMSATIPGSNYQVCPTIDARKGEVYAALFKRANDDQIKLTPDMLLTPEELAARVKEPTLFFGSGLLLYFEKIRSIVGEECFLRWEGGAVNGALGVARIAWRKLKDGWDDSSPQGLEPIYIRKSEAEINWERREAQKEGRFPSDSSVKP